MISNNVVPELPCYLFSLKTVFLCEFAFAKNKNRPLRFLDPRFFFFVLTAVLSPHSLLKTSIHGIACMSTKGQRQANKRSNRAWA